MKNSYKLYVILVVLASISCKREVKKTSATDDNLIEITKQQFQTAKMEFGKAERMVLKEKMAVTGKIVPTLNGSAQVSVPVPGRIMAVYVKNGQQVQAHEPLLSIGGGELIDLQQAFASSAAKIKHLKLKYEKTKQLFDEHIKTETEYLLDESNYNVELANYNALKTKLLNIGLNLADIKNGKYAAVYSIKSPIAGQASDFKVVTGQYVNTDTEILEITDQEKSELLLTLFEKDYGKTKVGQTVHFWSIGNDESKSLGTITRMAGKLNSNSNTINCYASISYKANAFAVNQMVNGEIIVSSDSVLAIPQTALLTIGNNHYVLIKKAEEENKYQFEKKKIRTGKSTGVNIELLDTLKEDILIKGSFNMSIE